MISVSTNTYRAAFAFKVMAGLSARKRQRSAELPAIEGFTTTQGRTAEVQEWEIAGETVGRRVDACGKTMCWLRADIAELADAHLETERQEIERMKAEVIEFAKAHPRADISGRPQVLSAELLHAAIRYSSRLGRLHDMDGRGDAERGRFAQQLAQLNTTGKTN